MFRCSGHWSGQRLRGHQFSLFCIVLSTKTSTNYVCGACRCTGHAVRCAHIHMSAHRTPAPVGSGLISSSPSLTPRHPAPRTGASARAVRLSPQVRGFGRLRINTGRGSVARVYLVCIRQFLKVKVYHSCSSGKFILDLLRISVFAPLRPWPFPSTPTPPYSLRICGAPSPGDPHIPMPIPHSMHDPASHHGSSNTV